jgi:hypothetical protein
MVSVPPLLGVPLFEVEPQAARSEARTSSNENKEKILLKPCLPSEDVGCCNMTNLLALNEPNKLVLYKEQESSRTF